MGKARKRKKIPYIQTSGVDAPERLYAPFIFGTTAATMNINATFSFLVKGVTVVKKKEAEKIKVGSFPSLREVME